MSTVNSVDSSRQGRMATPKTFARPEEEDTHGHAAAPQLRLHLHQIMIAQTFVQSADYARMVWERTSGHMVIAKPDQEAPNRLVSTLAVSPCGSGKTLTTHNHTDVRVHQRARTSSAHSYCNR